MPGRLCTKQLCGGGGLGQQRAQRLPQHQHRHRALGAQRTARGRAPSAILPTPLPTSGHMGLQGRGKGGLMGFGFLWAMPERKNVHLLHRHSLPALSFAAQTGLFQSLCFPALGNNNLWPLFFFFFRISQSKSLF